jgi:hypothetical protein
MLDFGIYIPEQDASWELVPNAFQELLHRHNRCDAKQCLCPKGRVHEMAGTRWELILCRYCGSQGIHIGCGLLKWLNPEWVCDECKTMLEQARGRDDTDSEEETAPSPSCVNQSPSKRKRQYYESFGESRRARYCNDRAIASSADPVPSSSQNLEMPNSQSRTCDRVSSPAPVAIIEISDDDDDDEDDDDGGDDIEIIDDDGDNEPPVKKFAGDNSDMILSCDGVAIPVIKVSSIPAAGGEQNICVVGGLNVTVAGHMQRTAVHQVTQTHSVSAVSHVPTLNTGPVSTLGTSFTGSSVVRSSSTVGCYSSQSYGSAGRGMLEPYLAEDASRGRPYIDQVSSVMQQSDAEVSFCIFCRTLGCEVLMVASKEIAAISDVMPLPTSWRNLLP